MEKNDTDIEAIRREGEALVAAAGLATAGGDATSAAPAALEASPTQAELDKAGAEEWAGFPFVFGSIVAEAMPEVEPVYTEARCIAWGEKMLPVARRYGWTAGVAGLWAGVIGATWAFAKPTWTAVRARRAAAAQAAAAQRRGQPADQAGTGQPVTVTGTEQASGGGASAAAS